MLISNYIRFLLIIPLLLTTSNDKDNSFQLSIPVLDTMLAAVPEDNLLHIGLPISISSWQAVIGREIAQQKKEAISKGITIVIKKNGKVGSRRFGVPLWEVLVDDVRQRKEAGLDVSNI